MKTPILPILLCTLLTACTGLPGGAAVGLGIGGISRHLGFGTSLSVPVGGRGYGGIRDLNVIEEHVVTYCAADGTAGNSAVKGGYYRQLLGRQGGGYLVQDFYEDNAAKRTDPMLLPRNMLYTFDAHPADGSLTVYARNGNVLRQQVYRNGQLIDAKY